MTFGEYIKSIRSDRNLTLRELSEITGISHTQINRLESGIQKKPRPETIKKLADGLSVEYSHLMKIAGYMEGVYELVNDMNEDPEVVKLFTGSTAMLSKKHADMFREFHSLSKENQKYVRELIKKLNK